jgi:hypothetical protein
MTIQEIVNKIKELKLEERKDEEIFLTIKELYPNFPDLKLKVLIGGIR